MVEKEEIITKTVEEVQQAEEVEKADILRGEIVTEIVAEEEWRLL